MNGREAPTYPTPSKVISACPQMISTRPSRKLHRMNASPSNATTRQEFALATSVIRRLLPNVLAIYVYGSMARGDHHTASDIDLGILLPRGERIVDLLHLTGALCETIRRDVNVVDLRRAGNVLRKEVLIDGVVLYAKDPDVLLGWEAEAMSEYAEHCTRIKDIVQQVADTGVGYGR